MIDKGALVYAVRNDLAGVAPMSFSAGGGILATLTDPAGNKPILNSTQINADGITQAFSGLVVVSALYGFNNVSAWDRIRAQANTSDNVAAIANGTVATNAYLYGSNGVTWDRIVTGTNQFDGLVTFGTGMLDTCSFETNFNGLTWDRVRAATVFKSVEVSAAGNTTIWTPASGKVFRLMGGTISACGTAASLITDLLRLTDGNGGAIIAQFRIAFNTTVSGDTQISFTLGNGRPAAAINVPLVANLATALATGSIVVNVYGTEE